MNFNALLQNKPALFGIIGGVVLLLVVVIFFSVPKGGQAPVKEEVITKPWDILTTDDTGKALELQALLAREGIEADRVADGSKSRLVLNKYTTSERDRALLAIVQSGIVDKHIGLEVFDKGDFTSSKEDKRIRLVRAINGELSRLIRKIPPIEDASVFVSIPEPTIFTANQKPVTATVQVTIPTGEKLERDKIRAITNLLMGSIQELEAHNISITDTNGNVYSSVISPEDDMMTLLEENDQYMKNKVQAQLDRLLGKGNYVVTVSTYLREAPLETEKVVYNPRESSVVSEQKFTESLGDKSEDKNKLSAAVSSFIPGGLPQSPDSSSNRRYSRSAAELQYGVGRTQSSEVRRPGMIEEISIAVTLDQGSLPSGITMDQLKELVAKAASPKVNPTNVEIAFSDMTMPLLSAERPAQLPKPEESGNPWWTVAALLGAALLFGLIFIAGRVKDAASKQQKEIENLVEKTELQQNQIREAHERASKLQALQEQIQHNITATKAPPAISTLQTTIEDIKENLDSDVDEKDFAVQLKSWIESTG